MLGDNARGALLMLGSMAAFTLNDTAIKILSSDIPLFQTIALRGVGTTVLLALLALALGQWRQLRLAGRDRSLIALRVAAEIVAAFTFIGALFHMELANATAILQAVPLAVTLAGAAFLGEPVGWKRLSAIVVGFLGVLLMVRPGTEGFTVHSLLCLAAVGAVTVRDLCTRRLSAAVPSMVVATLTAGGVGLAAAFAATVNGGWAPMEPGATGILAGASAAILFGYVFSILAMRVGEIAVVAPMRYSSLLWALLLGWLVFGDWPRPLTLAGAAIVVTMGVFTFYRERALGRSRTAGPQEVLIRPRT
ncbi:DMT family transporter [Tropicimonas sp. IMCC34011]|uniref:DMT family transporter n=1 Tax=Tropicimonas sp. IMCC34011 TaxID=2248759 RepID=UPI000E25CA52|nr:DMT family transporter [Tropicimonas sp. IMCC34011]